MDPVQSETGFLCTAVLKRNKVSVIMYTIPHCRFLASGNMSHLLFFVDIVELGMRAKGLGIRGQWFELVVLDDL
jgi:hypothetical protein